MIEIVRSLSRAVRDVVLVYGSLPPRARDLDLLARPPEHDALADALGAAGFVRKGDSWARFGAGSDLIGVDLTPAASWGLPEHELDALFTDAIPFEGLLARPAPHHALLILARRVAGGARLDPPKVKRLQEIIAADPEAVARARGRAADWGVQRALQVIDRHMRRQKSAGRWERAAALVEQRRASGRSGPRAMAAPLVMLRDRARGPAVVTISGLDGSGKSTQVRLLAVALDKLGYRAVIRWNRLTFNPSLDVIARPVKHLLRLRKPARPGVPAGSGSDGAEAIDRGPFVSAVWGVIVALANALSHRRAVLSAWREADVVLCDRYVLDSWVQLRAKYGAGMTSGLQRRVVRLLSPRPDASFFLTVPPEVSWARKQDEFSLAELQVQAADYERFARVVQARSLDGTRAPDELASEIARRTWLAI